MERVPRPIVRPFSEFLFCPSPINLVVDLDPSGFFRGRSCKLQVLLDPGSIRLSAFHCRPLHPLPPLRLRRTSHRRKDVD